MPKSVLKIIILILLNLSLFEKAWCDTHFQIYLDHQVGKSSFPNSENFSDTENTIHIPYFDGTVWFKVEVSPQHGDSKRFLAFTTPLSGLMTLYYMGQNGNWVEHARTGSSLAWSDRHVKSYYAIFELPQSIISNGGEVLIRREGHHLFDGKIEFLSQEDVKELDFKKTSLFFFYYGALIALLFYNLFLYIYGRERVYGQYVIFLTSVSLAAGTASGALDRFFDGWFIPSEYLLMFSSFATMMAAVFSRKFIDSEKYLPSWDKYFKWLGIIPMILFFIYIFFNSSITVRAYLGVIIDIIIPVIMLTTIGTSILAMKKGSPLAKFYLMSWVVLFLGVMLYLGGVHGVISKSIITDGGLMFGNIGEMLLLSMALAYRMNYIQLEKQEMEQKAKDKERYKRLVRVLCHDIANPLSIITSYTARIIKKGPVDPAIQISMAEKIQKASGIIEDLLVRVRNFESLDSKKELHLLPVYFKHIITESEFLLQEKLKEKNIELIYDQNEIDLWVLAERSSLLNNVMINILTNSIKFSNINSQIEIKVQRVDQLVQVTIRDFGVGMKKQELDQFSMLGQIDTKPGTSGEKGTGLGMSLMKSYMELFKGHVAIQSVSAEDSQNETGTTITLTFLASE
ncbi:MAG: hypothetical protein Fur0010_10510 [Bdellovibrio sp.]